MKSQSHFRISFSIFCLLLLLFSSCARQRTIVNALDEKEANEIVVFLSTRGINATKVKTATEGGGGGQQMILWDITVPAAQATEAMALLNAHGLPRRRGQSLLGIFSKSGLVPSELEEKIRFQAGLGEQLANTIRKFDGVLDADVQISFPKEDPLIPPEERQKKITASVYVKHSGVLDDPNSHLVTKIKRLVAGSINGLSFDNVTVIGDRARFTDIPYSIRRKGIEDKDYTKVWTLVIAKESLTRFRVVFFFFLLLILLLSSALGWIIWKMFPVIEQAGGFKSLFSLHPLENLHIENKQEEEADDQEEKEEKEETESQSANEEEKKEEEESNDKEQE